MVEKGMSCIKYLLFAFNLLFFIFGIVLIAVGAYIQTQLSSWLSFSDTAISAPAILIIVVGVITLIVAFFGCCGAVKEHHCMVMTFAVLVGILLICEIGAGIAGFVLKGDVTTLFDKAMKNSMKDYSTNDITKKAWDDMQKNLKCCGTDNSTDWATITKIPESCCKDGKTCDTANPDNLDKEGCLNKLEKAFKDNIGVVAGCGIGIAVVELLGVILACCLGRAIKNEYEVA